MKQDLFTKTNVPEFSVSELAYSLKKTLEDNYGRIRVRGELSRVTIPSSGHLYTSLKDENGVIDAVCWRGNVKKLSIKPEEGVEVICTGRISTYAPRSSYQLIIESMELAGEGALLKLLEERKKKLAAEGLFETEKKKRLPFLPQKIGVITSPTGAVIRDILHRLNDRFPRHVLLWPVMVQGDGAAKQVADAIRGFNKIPTNDPHRPDILIVARGGGSLEDLMPFNEEDVVRAAAESNIPIISAVGHETDTTLLDHAADLRAPTPTGAAEMAVPVRLNLIAQIQQDERRLINTMVRFLSENRHRLATLEANLGKPERILDTKAQKTDHLTHKMDILFRELLSLKKNQAFKAGVRLIHPAQHIANITDKLTHTANALESGFTKSISDRENTVIKKSQKLLPPKQQLQQAGHKLNVAAERLTKSGALWLERQERKLDGYAQKLELLSFENVLSRGYTVIFDEDGKALTDGDKITEGQSVRIRFRQKKYADAEIIKTGTENN